MLVILFCDDYLKKKMSHTRRNLVYTLLLVGLFFLTPQATAQDNNFAETQYFLDLIRSSDKKVHDRAFSFIDKNWKDEFEIMAIETVSYTHLTLPTILLV